MRNPYKSIAIILLLGFCCVSVIPILIIILEAADSGYENSMLVKLLREL